MSTNIVTDPTASGFNSFVSIEEADDYFSGVYFGSSTSWDELDEDVKARVLITASRSLSTLAWTGVPTTPMAFPRSYTSAGMFYSANLPSFLTSLVCEWAKWLWQEGPNNESGGTNTGIKSVKLDELEIVYDGTSAVNGGTLPPSIMSLLRPLSPLFLTLGNRARSMSMRY